MDFHLGEKVVYPNHGVGIIQQISTKNFNGASESYYLLKILSSSLRVMVPFCNAESVGLRRVSKGREVKSILRFMEKIGCETASNWKWRYKENCDKMRTGELQHVAEVLKCLLTLSQGKALSFREKKMLERAWQLLVEEIGTARNTTLKDAEVVVANAVLKANLKPVLLN